MREVTAATRPGHALLIGPVSFAATVPLFLSVISHLSVASGLVCLGLVRLVIGLKGLSHQ